MEGLEQRGRYKIDRISSTSGSLIPVSRKVKKCDGKLRNGYRCGLTYPNVNFYRVDVITTFHVRREGERNGISMLEKMADIKHAFVRSNNFYGGRKMRVVM